MSKKKLLIHEVFRQAKEECGKETKNGLAFYLWSYFDDHFPPGISDKTFSRYYDTFIRDDGEINIDTDSLNKLSQYMGYKDFKDFSNTFIKKKEDAELTTVKVSIDEDEETLSEKLSKIIINITNKPIFTIPEFFTKQSNLGVIGLILLGGYIVGGNMFKEKNENIPNTREGIANLPKCMYWNGTEYKQAYCEDKNPNHHLIPIDTVQLKYFKRITRKDTLTIKNASGKVWYSKYFGDVQFFTIDGKNPNNNRELRVATDYIISKYAK